MSAVDAGFRRLFLYLARHGNLRGFLETSPSARKLTSRFIAGLTLEDGLRVAKSLRDLRALTSLDLLGENVSSDAEARAARGSYVEALEQISANYLPATVSVKLTSLGLDLSEDLCIENANLVVQAAQKLGSVVEFDMEASSYTDRNLRIVREMHGRYRSVRAVIQAYLYRSESDIEQLNRESIPVRLCKGAYNEPPAVAFPRKQDVDTNYVKLMKLLLDSGNYPAIATHDESAVGQAIAHVRSKDMQPDQFEFQMLYGVGRMLQKRILARGFRLRIYVPCGTAWYPYFMRRLAERPANLLFLAKSLAKR